MADILSGKPRFNGDKNAPIRKIVQKDSEDSNDIYSEDEIRQKVRQHRITQLKVVAAVVFVIALLVLLVIYILDNRTYSSYKLTKSISREDVETSDYISYGDGYLRCSSDGISYFTLDGTAVWNQTFSMKKPQVKICDSFIAVGDVNGNMIYLFDKSGYISEVNTSLTISQVEVAKDGLVVAVLEDNNANYINMYDKSGEKIYSVKTTLSGDGYPFDVSITDDGTKLMAAYIYVSGEEIKNNIVFYNFSEVGKNETERVVGGYDFDSTIVGDVQFLTDTLAVAVSENSISLYKVKETPKLLKKISIDEEIQRIFYSDKYIGIVTDNTDSSDLYKLVVYNTSGNEICETTFDTNYDTIQFDDSSIVLNNDSSLCVMNMKGKVLANISFDSTISDVVCLGKKGKYVIINRNYIQTIKLK
jgi:hypothetical protein